jgi:FKBP-type peptidyl-prolyl cis-trans isomerase
MIKRIVLATLTGMIAISFTSCDSKGYKKTADGLEYQIVTDKKDGKGPDTSDIVKVKLRIYYSEEGKKDTLLRDVVAMNGGEPIELPMNVPVAYKSSWIKGLVLLTPGDSAIFRTPVDTLMKYEMQGQPLPPFMKKKGQLLFSVVLVSVNSADQMKKEQEQKSAQQKETDDKLIQDYLAKNNITASKTASGLYYVIDKEGTGNNPTAGQTVVVNYTGKTLDGKVFDSNLDPQFQHVEPLAFKLGGHEVIEGWDEGLALLKKGSKARLFIPSPLAYGPQERPGMPANSILMFEVELTDIKATAVQ